MRITSDEAVRRIGAGEIVGIPTDTVYGLAVSPHHQRAIEALYALKGRPEDKPCALLGDSLAQLMPLCESLPYAFEQLAYAFWPGALTLVVPASSQVPRTVTLGRDAVGLRIPRCSSARLLAARCGPLAVPSANPSGMPPALTPSEVEEYFGPEFPVLEGGDSSLGVHSTVLIWKGDRWICGRQGAVTLDLLAPLIGECLDLRQILE